MITIKRLFYAVANRYRKICNTLYYVLSQKEHFIIVNSYIYQLLDKVYHNNFGDDLNAILLSELSGKKVLAYNSFYHFRHPVDNIMAIGSVLGWMENSKTTVWGSGILDPNMGKQCKHYSIGKVCAVRGKLTRKCLLQAGIDCPEVYGDPALLMPLIYRPSSSSVKGRVGIIPHYVDTDSSHVRRLLTELGSDGVLIKVRGYNSWQEVIDLISSCEFIISSSLHGLILADAYSIPNQWVKFSNLITGGSFKFDDYYSAVGKESRPIIIDDDTHIDTILRSQSTYMKPIFDPIPLLKAFPYKIVHSGIRQLLSY